MNALKNIVYDVQRRNNDTFSSKGSSKIVSSRKKSLVNESYDEWNNKQGTRPFIVNKKHDSSNNNSTKQHEKKKKKKKKVSANGNISSSDGGMKEKEIKKKKKQEKKGKLQAATATGKQNTTTTRNTGSDTTTYASFAVGDRVMKKGKKEGPYVIINYLTAIADGRDKVIIRSVASFTPGYETLSVTKIVHCQEDLEKQNTTTTRNTHTTTYESFAVGDRVMKKGKKDKVTNQMKGPYVIVNYLTAITGGRDKVIIRSVASSTPGYETLSVTKIVHYQEELE